MSTILPTSNSFLAHSANPDRGVEAQKYAPHTRNVTILSTGFAKECVEGTHLEHTPFVSTVEQAAMRHDLGKLHEENQKVLRGELTGALRVKHENAGVQSLYTESTASAFLVQCHHTSVQDVLYQTGTVKLIEPDSGWLQDAKTEKLLDIHNKILNETIPSVQWEKPPTALDIRMMLSCLIDGDHTDTARNYRKEGPRNHPNTNWAKRLDQLIKYVKALPEDNSSPERKERQRLRNINFNCAIKYCNAPVGTGKTFSCLGHALAVANANNLRRIITVLPLTSIIDQLVEEYHKTILLPDENFNRTIAAVHHKSEYDSYWLRKYSQTFNSPLVVTTSVNFFETIAGARTSSIRKLHQYANSVIIIDEVHMALPIDLWKISWGWLKELVERYNCHIIIASGTMTRFWEIDDSVIANQLSLRFSGVVESKGNIESLVPEDEAKVMQSFEKKRVVILPHVGPRLDINLLCNQILSDKGPTCVVVNTIFSCAQLTAELMQRSDLPIIMVSTAFTPKDRNKKERRIKRFLKQGIDFIVVGTSAIETGLDWSFRRGFRERSSLLDILQLSGRINRNFEFGTACVVQEFIILDPQFHINPRLDTQIRSTNILAVRNQFNLESVDYYLKEWHQQLLINGNQAGFNLSRRLFGSESKYQLRWVADNYNVINANQLTVLVDNDIAERIRNNEEVHPSEIVENSVRIDANKLNNTFLRNGWASPLLAITGNSFLANLWVMNPVVYNSVFGHMGAEIGFIPQNTV
jgi:CRISPR-associated endonuclease/helicase Cas3